MRTLTRAQQARQHQQQQQGEETPQLQAQLQMLARYREPRTRTVPLQLLTSAVRQALQQASR